MGNQQKSTKLKRGISNRRIEMNEAALRFERAVLTAANTAADLALRTTDLQSKARKTARAHTGHDRAMWMLPRLDMSERDARIIYGQLDELKRKLLLLGCSTDTVLRVPMGQLTKI